MASDKQCPIKLVIWYNGPKKTDKVTRHLFPVDLNPNTWQKAHFFSDVGTAVFRHFPLFLLQNCRHQWEKRDTLGIVWLFCVPFLRLEIRHCCNRNQCGFWGVSQTVWKASLKTAVRFCAIVRAEVFFFFFKNVKTGIQVPGLKKNPTKEEISLKPCPKHLASAQCPASNYNCGGLNSWLHKAAKKEHCSECRLSAKFVNPEKNPIEICFAHNVCSLDVCMTLVKVKNFQVFVSFQKSDVVVYERKCQNHTVT